MVKKRKPKFRVGPRLLSAFAWKKRIDVAVWAEEEFVLESESAVGGGRFNLRYTPHLRLPLQVLGQHHTSNVTLWFGSQLGKTTVGMIYLNYFVDRIGGVAMFFLPTDVLVPFTATDRILPSLNRTVNKASILQAQTQRKLRDNTKNIRFIGGTIRILGANTASNRKSTPGKLIIMDEISEFQQSHVEEIEERAKTFELYGGKILKTSTSLYKNDPIVRSYKFAECQMEYVVKCQKCGKTHIDDFFANVVYPSREDVIIEDDLNEEDADVFYRLTASRSARYRCPHCNDLWDDDDFNDAIDKGDWKPNRGNPKTAGSIAFRASSMISKFVTIGKMVSKWLEVVGNEVTEEKFFNGWLSRIYEPIQKGTESKELEKMVSEMPRYKVPESTVSLVMSIDVQKDHFWFLVRAVTSDMTRYDIDYGRIETWHELENLLFRTYDDHFVEVVAIDSGYNSQTVYDFCYDMNHLHESDDPYIENLFAERLGVALNVIPIKGSNRGMTTISQITNIDKDIDGNVYSDSLKLHVINSMMFRDSHFALLKKSLDEEYTGKKRLYFHDESESTIFEQFVAEYKKEVIHPKTGAVSYEYVKVTTHADNHLLDCSVYAEYLIEKLDVRFRKADFILPSTQEVPKEEMIVIKKKKITEEERPDWLDQF